MESNLAPKHRTYVSATLPAENKIANIGCGDGGATCLVRLGAGRASVGLGVLWVEPSRQGDYKICSHEQNAF